MKRWSRWTAWICMLLVAALLSGCANAANYVKDTYPLVSVAGKGKEAAQVYEAEGKTVPEVAKELSAQEQPQEISKEDPDQMFLIYSNRIINLQKNPENAENTLIEIDSIEYAKENYDSSFLEGYLAATLLQSLLGGDWWDSSYKRYSTPYKGYSTSTGKSSSSVSSSDEKKPTTSDRTGSFNSKGTAASSGSTTSSKTSTSSKSSTGKWTSASSVRKNDGSTPSFKSSVKTKPSTSSRTGSFKVKRR